MKCKTSCFNPSLAKNDLRRFWPLPVCSFLMFFVSLVLPLYRHLYRVISGQLGYYTVDGESPVQIITAYAGTQFVIQTLILAAAALVTALLLFHHLHGKKEIQFYLSLPMRRSGLYLTSMLTGLLMILLPMVLCYGIAVGVCLHFGVTIQPILQLLAACCLMFLLFYGIAVLSCVLAGQRFGAFLLYAGIHGAAIIIWVGLAQVAACFIPGFSASINPPSWLTWQSPLLKIFSDGPLDPNNRIGLTIPMIYGAVGLILLVFSGLLYQIRRAETAGDMLSFSVIKIISKIFAALAVGLGSFALLQILAFPNQSVSFGILMLLVLVPMNMVAQGRRCPLWEVVPGVLLSMAAWLALSLAFSYYVEQVAHYSELYGSIATIVVVLLWLYMTGQVLIMGAEYNGARLAYRSAKSVPLPKEEEQTE